MKATERYQLLERKQAVRPAETWANGLRAHPLRL